MSLSSTEWELKKQHKTMAKIMLGLATLFIGTQAECEALAETMAANGEHVQVTEMGESELAFDVL